MFRPDVICQKQINSLHFSAYQLAPRSNDFTVRLKSEKKNSRPVGVQIYKWVILHSFLLFTSRFRNTFQVDQNSSKRHKIPQLPQHTGAKNYLFIQKLHTKNLMLEKCEFSEKWDFENVNFVQNEALKMWILWKLRLWKCEFLGELRIFAPMCPSPTKKKIEHSLCIEVWNSSHIGFNHEVNKVYNNLYDTIASHIISLEWNCDDDTLKALI